MGYTYFEFAQCDSTQALTASIVGALKTHYTNAKTQKAQIAEGFVPVPRQPASVAWRTVIQQHILAASDWQTQIGATTTCPGLAGR